MNARFTLKSAVLLGLVAILVALSIMDVVAPAQAASPVSQTVSPTFLPAHYTGERTPETGIVSITCRNRNLFEYHNEDKTKCGDAVAVEMEKDGNDSTSVNQISTPAIIDDGGVNIPNDGNTGSQHTNNGNHYGNDKPDNNAKDVKNKHNGENTAAEHHNEQKKDNGKSK